MFRVARYLPIVVVSPQPWFPLQGLIRLLRPNFRPRLPAYERLEGIEVYRPRYLSVPAILKRLDGWLMSRGTLPTVRRLCARMGIDVIDAHFAYPDGYAAVLVAKKLGLKCTITLRGTEARHMERPALRARIETALVRAERVFAVSESLRRLAIATGVPGAKVMTVGNGVDADRFRPQPRDRSRVALGIPLDAKVLVTVGGLVERKGFHRVVDRLPSLRATFPTLRYLIVGGPGPEGDFSAVLHDQVRRLGLTPCVAFLGPLEPERVCQALSAADLFVLATRNEGWANVLLEAMACGLPVITTSVGGNAEVVCHDHLGTIVPFGDAAQLEAAIRQGLTRDWDRGEIRRFAASNGWQKRVEVLVNEFIALQARGDDGDRTLYPRTP
jgi:glycosyltransferase involved in cell wall biosynthesis